MVARQTLTLFVWVQILVPQPDPKGNRLWGLLFVLQDEAKNFVFFIFPIDKYIFMEYSLTVLTQIVQLDDARKETANVCNRQPVASTCV